MLMIKQTCTILLLTLVLSPVYAASHPVHVVLTTSLGEIQLTLHPEKAPKTVKNFLNYVESKHYDGLIFHRVIKNFVIQAGGFDQDLSPREPSRNPIINESSNGLKNAKGTIAMARQQAPNSARAQFYINVTDNWGLDPRPNQPGYTVFGQVSSGLDVVEKIASVPTKTMGGYANVPVTPVTIIKATISSDK